ncbi:uncharacterized protein LOC116343754 [Contarinia nasturtii]|uniref:uncharacterized protein LOC116343754 n=1 Tax=Contarinia nasturtii TaxID=265458 RepID=UPI0012D3DDF3|nr:uncharacterized protein LOC116343754 [Contarinia nasturtii]
MDRQILRELVVKNALEVLQNVLPTNITEQLERLDADEEEGDDRSNDLDEDRFFYEFFTSQTETPKIVVKQETNESNESLTYFQIVEQEMMEALPITKYNMDLLKLIIEDFGEITPNMLDTLNVPTIDQLTNIFLYSLMTNEDSKQTEETLILCEGTVNKVLTMICAIIAQKRDVFIHFPNGKEIQQNVRQFERFTEFGEYEFYNVFGALGTTDFQIKPPLSKYLSVPATDGKNIMYTPIKWQCSCDVSGFLQSSLVLIPKKENETKNSYVFEMNPLKAKLEAIKTSEYYLVADGTLTLIPFLLTPHEKLLLHAEQHNRALESKRKIIDKTFDKIRSRFTILNRIELRDATSICNLVETIGILHNFFLVQNDELYMAEFSYQAL